MDEICYIIVDGLTKSAASAEKKHAITSLLQKWFPKSHCHSYDPFTKSGDLVPETDIIEEVARDLLQDISRCTECSISQQDSQDQANQLYGYRPLVLLGHDVGGSIIKKALLLASDDSSYKEISAATIAVAFFGGLHRATESSTWEHHFIRLLAISQRDIRTLFPITQALIPALTALSQSFVKISGAYTVLNVYQDSDNATIPKYTATLESAAADQIGSTKTHDQLLELLEIDLTAQWLHQKLVFLTKQISSRSDEHRTFIRYLTQIEPRLHEVDTRSHSPGSLDWIKKLKSFKKWSSSSGISFLHIYGTPGSGATVVTSNLDWILSEAQPGTDICFLNFSFNKQNVMASSAQSMVLSLICQLLSRRPSLFQNTHRLCMWLMQTNCINLDVLWVLFESLLSHMEKERVLLAIRAIQECNTWNAETLIIDRLLSLRRIPKLDMKIILTSESSKWALPYSGEFNEVPMNKLSDVTDMLERLIRLQVQRLAKGRSAWRNLDEVIIDKFWSQDQNYHLAMAKVQSLEMESRSILSSKAAMITKLETFPSDTESFFLRMVGMIPDSYIGWIREAFQWIVFALQPLSPQQLGIVVAFNQYGDDLVKQTSLKTLETRVPSDLPGDINRSLGYWIRVTGNHVEMANPALASFLISKFNYDELVAHARMLKKSLDYLKWARVSIEFAKGNALDPVIPGRSAYDFLQYATLCWPLHFQLAGDVGSDLVKEVQQFLEDPKTLEFWSSLARYHGMVGLTSEYSVSPLKTAAFLGLGQLVDKFIAKSRASGDTDEFNPRMDAMNLAIERGHSDVAWKLFQTILDSGLVPRLHKVAEKGNLGLLEEFLKVEAVRDSINDADTIGYSPLLYAAQAGQKDVVDILLQNGAKADFATEEGSTALHLAATIGHLDIATLLINKGADLSVCGASGYNSLQLAAQGGFVDLIAYLLPLFKEISSKCSNSKTPLHLTAMYGHNWACEYLIQSGAVIKTFDEEGMTPVHLAVLGNFVDTVRMLIEASPAPPPSCEKDVTDEENQEQLQNPTDMQASDSQTLTPSPLQLAADKGSIEILRLILEHSYSYSNLSCDCLEAISRAAVHDYWELLKVLLDVPGIPQPNPIDSKGNSALHLACEHGHVNLVKKLLESGKYGADFQNAAGLAPLHIASMKGHVHVVKALLEKWTTVDCEDSSGGKAIHFAVEHGHLPVVKALQECRDMRLEKDGDGNTPVLIAAISGHVAIVDELLSTSENDDSNPEELWGNPFPLHQAVDIGNETLCHILISHGHGVDSRDQNDNTPLHVAAALDSVKMIECMMKCGASLSATNDEGETALLCATKLGNEDACRAILESGATDFIDIPDKEMDTPLYKACVDLNTELAELLLQYHANPNKTCSLGWTPLHAAASEDDTEIMQLLFNAGAKQDILNVYQSTPIVLAAQEGCVNALRMLLERGASVKVVNKTGSTALHRAAQASKTNALECVKLLVEAGADINAAKKNGATPLHMAVINSVTSVVEFLVGAGANVNFESESLGTPLQLSIHTASPFESLDITEYLLNNNADPNISGGVHGSALTVAINKDSVEAVALLMEKGATPVVVDKNTTSLLSYAIDCRSWWVVEYLLSRTDIPVHDADRSQRTPLMKAAMLGRHDLLKTLLDRHADPNVRDSEGKTSLIRAIASQEVDIEIVKTLLSRGSDPLLTDCRKRGALYWACLIGNITVVEEVLGCLISLSGQLAFHATASAGMETTASKKREILDLLLDRRVKLDLAERDDDGWTAPYTATRYGLTEMEETLAEAMILHSVARQPSELKRPVAWHRQDKSACLVVSEDGLSVSVGEASLNPKNEGYACASIRADHCMPGDGVYYFEITIDEDADAKAIGIGFCAEHAPLDRFVGWDQNSWGYHGDTGTTFEHNEYGQGYDKGYAKGVTIGCGVHFEKETAFFTRDGELIRPVFQGIKGKLYPAVTLAIAEPIGAITANFGPEGFEYENWKSDSNFVESSPPPQKTTSWMDPYDEDSDFDMEFTSRRRRRRLERRQTRTRIDVDYQL
jgi:ankyrin